MARRGHAVTADLQPHDPFTVDTERTLDALRADWGAAYEIGYSDNRWVARRKDGAGEPLRGLTPDDLAVAMRADWERPVRRPAAADSPDAYDEITMDGLRERWAGEYDLGFAGGEFHAFRLIGGQPITARSLGELESAIRADYARRTSR